MLFRSIKKIFLLIVFLTFLSGCSVGINPPELNEIYSQSAMQSDLTRNPVIVIPGILGSRLRDTKSGKLIWGAFGGEYADPSEPREARVISLPMRYGEEISMLQDEIVVEGSLDRIKVSLLGLPLNLNAYIDIISTLGAGGFRDEELALKGAIDYGDEHFTCFQFAYDWRLGNVQTAKALGEFIRNKQKYISGELKRRYGVERAAEDIKFDIVAHSMGGLAARYYLRYGEQKLPESGDLPEVTWAGAKNISSVIIVGTPSAGSVESFVKITNGAKFVPFFPKYPAVILGTFPSIYQLLPRPRHKSIVFTDGELLDIYDLELWKKNSWGLANQAYDDELAWLLPEARTKQERRKIALDHLSKILKRTEQFHKALDRPVDLPDGVSLKLIAGDSVQTDSVYEINRDTGGGSVISQSPGDGTVLRSSALMDERLGSKWSPRLRTPIPWSDVTFLFSDHIGLTKSPVFSDNVLYYLLERPL